MSTKGDGQSKKKKKKKKYSNTAALKTRVPGEGTQESRHFFCRKKEVNYLLV